MQLIPNAFVRLPQLQGRIPEDVILRNASGRAWHVKTRYVEEKLYFDDGWRAFHQENCLGQADFLVFKHERRNEFVVLILQLSTQCQKPLVKMEEEQAATQLVEEPDSSSDDDDEESGEEFSAGFNLQSHHRRACKSKFYLHLEN